ncbi:hypothetical protein C7A07_21405 [Pseudomonas fragi]|nr:hypothetical protein C7A07_21405 [Pseudomonas fragi]
MHTHDDCGSGLARDGITSVHQINRGVCIASKPAPTHAAPTLLKGHLLCVSSLHWAVTPSCVAASP